jgi:hypothetical protein
MNIEKFSGVNMMGFQRVSLIKASDVAGISLPDNNEVTVTLKAGRQWSEVYFTIEKGTLQVVEREDDAGNYFTITATIEVPKVQAASLEVLNNLKYRHLLLKVTNNNGENWLIGTIEQPCKMIYSTGQSWNKTNAIEVKFSVPESDTHPYLIDETLSGGAFSNGFSNGFAI